MSPRILLIAAVLFATKASALPLDAFDELPEEGGAGEWSDELVRLVADGDVTLDRAEYFEPGVGARQRAFVLKREGNERRVRHVSCDELAEWMRIVATPEPIVSGGFVYEWRYDQLFYGRKEVASDSTRAIECPLLAQEAAADASEGVWDEELDRDPGEACSEGESQTLELFGPWVVVENGWSTYCGGIHGEHGGSWSVAYVGRDPEPILQESVDMASLVASGEDEATPSESDGLNEDPRKLLKSPHYFSGYDAATDFVEVTFGVTPPFCRACLNEPWPLRFEAKVTSTKLRKLLKQMFPEVAD